MENLNKKNFSHIDKKNNDFKSCLSKTIQKKDKLNVNAIKLRATKIIATIGPACSDNATLKYIIKAGVNVVRLNFSHGNVNDHYKLVAKIRTIALELNCTVAIMVDLQGPKIRIGKFENDCVTLINGYPFILDINCKIGNNSRVGLSYHELLNDVLPGDILLLDDGSIILDVVQILNNEIHTIVRNGGKLFSNKGINKKGGGLSAPSLTKKDVNDINTAMLINADYIAISFPKSAKDIEIARKLVIKAAIEYNNIPPKIIAKIERAEAIPVLNEILCVSDGIMIARGDLAIEVGTAIVPVLQKQMIKMAHAANRIVITATQMMESMIQVPVPTRAEVSDVANAVFDGTDAVMLSAESAIGKFPVEAVKTMVDICVEAEKSQKTKLDYTFLNQQFLRIDQTLAISALFAAYHLNAKAIVVLTESGLSALLISRYISNIPILGITPNKKSEHLMAIYRNVIPIYFVSDANSDCITNIINILLQRGFVKCGDNIVFTYGDFVGKSGNNNILKIINVK